MKSKSRFSDSHEFALYLTALHEKRGQQKQKATAAGPNRRSLTRDQRAEILVKTNGRCHICGGEISEDQAWQADHVFAHAQGGDNSIANYLPAHSICNNYRWFYGAEGSNGYSNSEFGCERWRHSSYQLRHSGACPMVV